MSDADGVLYARRKVPPFATAVLCLTIAAWTYLTVDFWYDERLIEFRYFNVAVVAFFAVAVDSLAWYKLRADNSHVYVRERPFALRFRPPAGWPKLEKRPMTSIVRLEPALQDADEWLSGQGNFSRLNIFFADGRSFPMLRSWVRERDLALIVDKIWSARPDLINA